MRAFFFLGAGIFLASCSASVVPAAKKLENGGFSQKQSTNSGQADNPVNVGDQIPEKTKPEESVSTSDPAIMNLDEAKSKCAACHQPGGGDGANAWNTANGTEDDWKLFAPSARAAVESNQMPPGVGLTEPDKTRLIAYLSKLIAETPQASPTPTPTPTPVSYSFDTAKVLCTGCHGKNQRRPQLTTIDQWRDKKTKILNAVKDKSMPRGKELTEAERGALVRFIESL